MATVRLKQGSGSKKPNTDQLTHYQVTPAPGVSIFGWDAEKVHGACQSHKAGNFVASGRLQDDMKTNPILRHCNDKRTEVFDICPNVCKPGKGSGATRFAGFVKEAYSTIINKHILKDWWVDFTYAGESISAMEWEKVTDGPSDYWFLPKIKPWHRTQLRKQWKPDDPSADLDGTITVANTVNQGEVVVEPGKGRWIHFKNGAMSPWLNGLVLTLGDVFLGDTYTFRDNLALQERFGQGFLKFFHPVEWHNREIGNTTIKIKRAGKGAIVPLPMDSEGKRRADIENVNANATGYPLFDQTEKRIIRRFLLSLLGQDMTSVGQTGGFAQANIHNGVMWNKREYDCGVFGDARLIIEAEKRIWRPCDNVIRLQISKWVAYFNTGSFDMAPYYYWDATPPEDFQSKKEAAEVGAKKAQTLMQIIQCMEKGKTMLPNLDWSAVLDVCHLGAIQGQDEKALKLITGLPKKERMVILTLLQAMESMDE